MGADEYRSRYRGWTVKHFHDRLRERHGFAWSYTWTKTTLQRAGLVSKAPRRGVHRRRRERKPCVGMMVHQDGSRHLAGVPPLDLIVTMDDATSEIYSAFLVEEEGTASTFRRSSRCSPTGLPGSLYTDRGSRPRRAAKWTRATRPRSAAPSTSSASNTSPPTRPRHAAAPMVKELSLAGEIEAANRFIADTYLPDHNRRFATKPELEASAFASPPPPDQVHEVLCLHTKRVSRTTTPCATKDGSCKSPPARSDTTTSRPRSGCTSIDGTLALFHGPRCLARYQADGEPIDTSNRQAA